MKQWLSLLFAILIVLGLTVLGLSQPVQAAGTEVTWFKTLHQETGGEFARAIAPRDWQFPQDFGPHNDYQTEWWYYTGNLETATGRPFGFQLTFFRQALQPDLPELTTSSYSPWRSSQIYSAHFTLSDIAKRHFHPYERFSRGSVGLAGAEAMPDRIWLEDWSTLELESGQVRLQAQTADVAIDLLVSQTLPPILHGDRGWAQKGPAPGNASYYYSLVQQPTTGTITIAGQTYDVTGLTWKDHEYATRPLSPETKGWDWFSLQFDNGTALMLYLLRHTDGSLEPTSAGTFVSSAGDTIALKPQDWHLQVLDTWESPRSGAVYPARWQLSVPRLNLTIRGKPLMANQELQTTTATYWEGAVAFQGQLTEQTVQGKGYVELTGYASDRLDRLLAGQQQ